MPKIRPYTEEEVKDKFVRNLKGIAKYWSELKDKTDLEKIEGAIFSTLTVFDGGCLDLPGFIVAPLGDKNDIEFFKRRGENWFPVNSGSRVKCDIAGSLHNAFNNLEKRL